MNKKRLFLFAAPIVLIFLAFIFFGGDSEEEAAITVKVKKEEFLHEVFISGEAQSTSSQKVNGPTDIMKFRLYNVKIQDLVAEGTVVKKGDYVGKLDQSEINGQIVDARLNLDNAESKFTQKQLDTTLTLKQERTAIEDLLFDIEEKKLELKQSIYEPPSTIKQLEINVERLERDLKEKKENYIIKKRKSIAEMVEVGTEVSKIKQKMEELTKLQSSFTIHSDADGMIIYHKNRDGTKRIIGSNINPWDPTIATLPDLTKMESKTYANEVDIRKIKKDLPVTVGFDAFPDVFLNGVVTSVANVGEKKRGSDINLFQVMIKLNETNTNVRPGMTTSNRILISKQEDVLTIPLDAIFSQDSTSFAYVKSGLSVEKREIELGESNIDVAIITKGLKENDEVYLSKPDGLDEKEIKLLK